MTVNAAKCRELGDGVLDVAVETPRLALAASSHTTSRDAIKFASGRRVEAEDGPQDRLTVSSPEGRFELAIRFTDSGAVVEIDAVSLAMRAASSVAIDCDTLLLHAREALVLQSEGRLIERTAGDKLTEVAGEARVAAREVSIAAEDGHIKLDASQDLRLDGHRVLVNC